MNLGTVVAESTLKAAVEILHRQGKTTKDCVTDRLVQNLKAEAKAALHRILDQGKEILDANVGDGWLRLMINTECVDAARRAVAASE